LRRRNYLFVLGILIGIVIFSGLNLGKKDQHAQELFKNLIRSINGIFYDKINYDIPNILYIFNQEEVNELDKLIKQIQSYG